VKLIKLLKDKLQVSWLAEQAGQVTPPQISNSQLEEFRWVHIIATVGFMQNRNEIDLYMVQSMCVC